MAKYKYIIRRAFKNKGNSLITTNDYYVVGRLDEDEYSEESHIEKLKEFSSIDYVQSKPINDIKELKINKGKFTIGNGSDGRTVQLSGKETCVIGIAKCICRDASDMVDVVVYKKYDDRVGENKSWIELRSKSPKEEIIISPLSNYDLSNIGFEARVNRPSEEEEIKDLELLGETVDTIIEIENPDIERFCEYTIKMKDEKAIAVENIIKPGITKSKIEEFEIPEKIKINKREFVVSEFDDSVDKPIKMFRRDNSHLYKVGIVGTELDENKNFKSFRAFPVKCTDEEREAEQEFRNQYEKIMDKNTSKLIKEWCVNNGGDEQKFIHIGLDKALGVSISKEESTLWDEYQTARKRIIKSQKKEKIKIGIKDPD